MRRRDALKSIGALAGAGAASRLLGGCGDNLGAARRDAGAPDAAASADAAGPDAAVVQGITTVVVVMMENRSYDHYLGARGLIEGLPGDGLVASMTNPDVNDAPVPIYRETDFCVADPPHGWNPSRTQWNGGLNDGFVRAYRAAHEGETLLPYVMGHFGREDIPLTWSLADSYASCDRWFSSVLGPTWPNRMYLHSGQSGGLMSNTLPPGGITWRAIQHELSDAGVPWAYYYNDLPFLSLFRNLSTDGTLRRFVDEFFDDAAAGALPRRPSSTRARHQRRPPAAPPDPGQRSSPASTPRWRPPRTGTTASSSRPTTRRAASSTMSRRRSRPTTAPRRASISSASGCPPWSPGRTSRPGTSARWCATAHRCSPTWARCSASRR